jgi:hypothetical protein
MLSALPTTAVIRPSTTAASVASFAGLVRKIETSPASSFRKRKSSARKRLTRVIREQRRFAKTVKFRAVTLTLTYRDSAAFSPKHISSFLDRLRRTLKRKGYILPYAWVLERASRLHYHLIVWLPRSFTIDTAKLAKWWPWGRSKVEACHRVGACAKYMVKFDGAATLPKGARLYGYGGLDEAGEAAVSRAALPRWLQAVLPIHARVRRRPGGGWEEATTGKVHHSPYVWTPWGAKLRSISPPVCR